MVGVLLTRKKYGMLGVFDPIDEWKTTPTLSLTASFRDHPILTFKATYNVQLLAGIAPQEPWVITASPILFSVERIPLIMIHQKGRDKKDYFRSPTNETHEQIVPDNSAFSGNTRHFHRRNIPSIYIWAPRRFWKNSHHIFHARCT